MAARSLESTSSVWASKSRWLTRSAAWLGVGSAARAGVPASATTARVASSPTARPRTSLVLQLELGLVALGLVDLVDRGPDRVVDQDQAAEDVADVREARGGHEALLLGLVARDEARVLPRVEVLRHRRRHHDHGRERVLERR